MSRETHRRSRIESFIILDVFAHNLGILMINQSKPISWPKEQKTRKMLGSILAMQEHERNLPSTKRGRRVESHDTSP
jgi:hypothetical protein